jgi:hypothetical protein
LTTLRLESTIYHTLGEYFNHYTTDVVSSNWNMGIMLKKT